MTVPPIDGLTTSIAVKIPCRLIARTPLTLSGLQTVDSVDLAADDRVLVAGQASPIDNGIYVVATTAWTRALDCNGPRDLVPGSLVWINEGTFGNTIWRAVASGSPIIPGSTAMTWEMRWRGGVILISSGQFGALTVGGSVEWFCGISGGMTGNVSVGGTVRGLWLFGSTGDITISAGGVAHDLQFNANFTGSISISGNLAGGVRINGTVGSAVTINGQTYGPAA